MNTSVPNVPQIPSSDVLAVTLSSRIPEFWVDQPRVWFIRVEAILAPQKLSDDARFDLVVAKLPKDVIVQLSDFLAKPPESGKFMALKSKMLVLFEDSTNRQIEKLIGEMELGDQKPSQLLHRMRDLARDKIPDDTLRVLWQGHLPTTVRAVLAVSDTKVLDKLAVIADNVAEATRVSQVSEVTQKFQTAKEHNKDSSDLAQLTAEIAKINAKLSNLERSRSRPRYNSCSPRRVSRSASRRRTPCSPDWLCSYHFRYRHRAHRCVPPCAWNARDGAKEEEASQSRSGN